MPTWTAQEIAAVQRAQPQLNTQELAMADKVGQYLLPIVRQMVARAKSERDDATATFARDWTLQQMALDALPDGAAPMAKVELELKQRELVAAFVAAQKV